MTTDYNSIWTDLQGVAFEQAYVDVDGVRTRYLRAGRKGALALIFIHGTGGHAEAYVRNLAAHGEHFDVYAIDMLGHGFTGKPDRPYLIDDYVAHLRGFLDKMGLDRASLSGESLGGWVAAHFAVVHPERVAKLVLNTASGDKVNREALARLRVLSVEAIEDPSYERIKGRLEWLMYDKSKVLMKTYQASEMKRVDGHWYASKGRIENHREKHTTDMYLDETKPAAVSDGEFTVGNLEKL